MRHGFTRIYPCQNILFITIMVRVELNKIIIDEKRQEQVIVLTEKDGKRQFPIVIGILEASSIRMKLSGIKPPRPLTHDLLAATLKGLEVKLDKLIIDKMVDNTFHAKLELIAKDGEKKVIDSRPSDGIALAVRCKAPIFVEEEVLDKVAIYKDK